MWSKSQAAKDCYTESAAGSLKGLCPAPPMSEIPEVLNDARTEARLLRDSVERLVERVGPVLSPSNPSKCEASMNPPIQTEVGGAVSDLAASMRATRAVVEEAMSRIQL